MSFFRFLFNLFWFRAGRRLRGLAWWLAGLLCFVSLIRDPLGRACFVIGTFHLLPVWQAGGEPQEYDGPGGIGTGALGLIGNILWFVLIGVWLAIGHIASAAGLFRHHRRHPVRHPAPPSWPHQPGPIGQMIVTNHEAESGRYIR